MDTSSSNGKRPQESGDVATPSAKKQKLGDLGERKSDGGGGDDYLVPLRLTARSGYLAVEEVARLLLFTGKTFMGDIFGDLASDVRRQRLVSNVPFVEDIGPFRYVHNIEVTRNAQTKTFGFYIQSFAADRGNVGTGCIIIKTGPLMQSSAVIEEEDVIVSINGKDARGWRCQNAIQEMRAIHGDTLSISIRRFHPDVKTQVWKCICQHKWRDFQALSRLMHCVGKRCSNGEADWDGLFQKFCQKRKPRLTGDARDCYNFLVSVYDNAGASLDSAPVASLFIDGNHSRRLITKGDSGWLKFDSPIKLGTFACSKDIRKEVRKLSIGLHILRKTDKKTRKVDLQLLDSKKKIVSHTSSEKGDCGEGKRQCRYFTRKREPFKGIIIGCNLSDLVVSGRIHSKVDIEFKRNLRYCTVKHNDGKRECSLDAISVSALMKIETADKTERERTYFSKHAKVKSGVTLAKFLARAADGWE